MTHEHSDRSFDYEAQEAVVFLVRQVTATGHNPKPVIWHSLRVGMRLYEEGYPRDVVIAALLHDLLEDTEVDPQQIVDAFGDRTLQLVEALSFDLGISDPAEQFMDRFERCKVAGPAALAIMAADFLDNSYFYQRPSDGGDLQLYYHQLWKARTFLAWTQSTSDDQRLATVLADLQRSLQRHAD